MRIEAGRIAAVGRLRPRPGECVVDARGLAVAPGFINARSHADGGLLEDPNAETMIRQGIPAGAPRRAHPGLERPG